MGEGVYQKGAVGHRKGEGVYRKRGNDVAKDGGSPPILPSRHGRFLTRSLDNLKRIKQLVFRHCSWRGCYLDSFVFCSQFLKTLLETRGLSTHPNIPEGEIEPIVIVELFVMVVVMRGPNQPFC